MTSAPHVTPQRIRAARLLKQLNDADALPTDPDVLALARLDPDAPGPAHQGEQAQHPPADIVDGGDGRPARSALHDLPEDVLERALAARRARSRSV